MISSSGKNNYSLFWCFVSIYVVSNILFNPRIVLGGLFDRDPIGETQTKAVPATEETIKNSGKGAPAPTFKIVQDTGEFFVEKPYYEEVGQKKKSKWSWWWDQEVSQPQENKEDADSLPGEEFSKPSF